MTIQRLFQSTILAAAALAASSCAKNSSTASESSAPAPTASATPAAPAATPTPAAPAPTPAPTPFDPNAVQQQATADTDIPKPAPSDFPDKVMNESTKHWIERWRLFRSEAGTKAGVTVFVGDSMTERFPIEQNFPRLDIVNRGIGGDKIGGWKYYGILDRMDVSVAALKPRVVVVMIGVNDIVFASTPRENMAANYDRMLKEMRAAAPEARLIVLPVLPVRTSNKDHNAAITAFNQVIRRSAQQNDAQFYDLYPLFLDSSGELNAAYASDTIHLNEDGYRVWSDALRPLLEGTGR